MRLVLFFGTKILDINYVHFQRDFIPQAELEEGFTYIIHKPTDFSIDFSCRRKSANRNSVPRPNTKNYLLSLSELADRK